MVAGGILTLSLVLYKLELEVLLLPGSKPILDFGDHKEVLFRKFKFRFRQISWINFIFDAIIASSSKKYF